jgi:hypothetical protein
MKKLVLGTILLALALVWPASTTARAEVRVSISLPPIIFSAPPALIVLPETYVYAVPDVDVDIFFYNGWWWRPWEGRWYRSRNYNSGWDHYGRVPSFYQQIPPGWRDGYREGRWKGHPWNHKRIPHRQVQRNWKGWERNKHWEKQNTWGVRGLKPQKRSQKPSQGVHAQSQAKPQPRKTVNTQHQPPQHREAAETRRPEHQAREAVRPQHTQPQQRTEVNRGRQPEAPQPSDARQKKSERGEKGKKDR